MFSHSKALLPEYSRTQQRNILATKDGVIVIADFGYTRVLHSEKRQQTTPQSITRAYRYLAPEVINVDAKFRPTPQTDTYALAMTIVELGTGELPFKDVKDPSRLLNQVIDPTNYRPQREQSLGFLGEGPTTELWKCLEGMWHAQPNNRPKVASVLRSVEKLHRELSIGRSVSTGRVLGAVTTIKKFFRSSRVQWDYHFQAPDPNQYYLSHLATIQHGNDTTGQTRDMVRSAASLPVPGLTGLPFTLYTEAYQ
jgi:serine/threonine protein kinase